MILGEQITKRLINKILMDLRIATNPHLQEPEAKKLVDELMAQRRALWGPAEHGGTLDKSTLDMLKDRLKKNSNSIKVK